MRTLTACHLGAVPYREGLALQEALVRARASGGTGDWLLYPDHPPVLTVGRSPSPGNLRADEEALARAGIEVFEVARGGDITWHGPGQLVGYPVVALEARGRDLHRFLRDLEQALLDAIASWGVEGRRVAGRTGVWVGDEKLASIGIAVRRWVSYHGFALNVRPDLEGFELIHPCGLRGVRMTSLARLLGPRAPTLAEARERVAGRLAERLGYDALVWASADEARRTATGPGSARDPDRTPCIEDTRIPRVVAR